MSRKAPTCSACAQIGHTKSSLSCPLRQAAEALADARLLNLVGLCTAVPIDWNEIGALTDTMPDSCRLRYERLVPMEDRLRRNSGLFDLVAVSVLLAQTCTLCGSVSYMTLHPWKDAQAFCDTCYAQHTQRKRAQRWAEVKKPWLAASGSKRTRDPEDGRTELNCAKRCRLKKAKKEIALYRCTLCGRESPQVHFDHRNMFKKLYSVCTLIEEGYPTELIEQEVAQCQLVCRSCHAFITHVEVKLGFTGLKRHHTTAETEVPLGIHELYDCVMEGRVYPFLRSVSSLAFAHTSALASA